MFNIRTGVRVGSPLLSRYVQCALIFDLCSIYAHEIRLSYTNYKSIIIPGNGTINWVLNGQCNYLERCEVTDAKSLKSTPWNSILDGGYPEPFYHGDM